MKKKLAVVLCAAMMTVSLAACGGSSDSAAASEAASSVASAAESAAESAASSAAESAAESTAEAADDVITVTDMSGEEVTINGPVERVVTIAAADCEIVYALGAGDKLVGRGEYCDWPEEAANVTAVSSGADTNVEEIIALDPQVVIMDYMAQSEEQVAALREAGIAVVMTNAQTIDEVYTAIELIGAVVQKDDEAATLVSDMKAQFETLAADAAANASDETKTIYFEVSPLEYGLWAAGSGTFMNEIAEMLGVENIFGDQEGWVEVSEEQVIEAAPDYIVTITMYFGEGPTPEEEIASRAGWENIPAVANGDILDAPNNELSRPGPRLADGAQMLYDFIYEDEAAVDAAA